MNTAQILTIVWLSFLVGFIAGVGLLTAIKLSEKKKIRYDKCNGYDELGRS